MAKVAFTKLNKIESIPAVTHSINGVEIEVEQYLPLDKKLDLIQAVIEQSGNGEEGFFNIVKLETYFAIEMVKAYTNITFTDEQLDEIPKLFDTLVLNQVWQEVKAKIPTEECEYIWSSILSLAKETTAYNNSVLGVLKQLTRDKEALALDVDEIAKTVSDPGQLEMIKQLAIQSGLIN